MIDPEIMSDIRKRINPQYQHTIGTESYERKLLVDEIDRLQSNDMLMHEQLYLVVNKLMATIGAYGEVRSDHEDVSAVMDALYDIDGGVPPK